MTTWLSNAGALIAIIVFLGLGENAPKFFGYDPVYTKWIVYAIAVFLAFFNSYRLLELLRRFTKWLYRKFIGLRIDYPQVGEAVSDSHFTVRRIFRSRPDARTVIIFHKAKEGYYPQEPLVIETEGHRWAAGVTIGSAAHENYTIVVAKCSEDVLALINYFNLLTKRSFGGTSIGYQAFPIQDDLPGFCILASIRVKLIPRFIDGGTF
jgi:hypothetical protein